MTNTRHDIFFYADVHLVFPGSTQKWTQDVARCDLCKTTIAQSYCDFCHVNLCKPCIGEHFSDEYDKHKIVPIHKRKSTLMYLKCGTHTNLSLIHISEPTRPLYISYAVFCLKSVSYTHLTLPTICSV